MKSNEWTVDALPLYEGQQSQKKSSNIKKAATSIPPSSPHRTYGKTKINCPQKINHIREDTEKTKSRTQKKKI